MKGSPARAHVAADLNAAATEAAGLLQGSLQEWTTLLSDRPAAWPAAEGAQPAGTQADIASDAVILPIAPVSLINAADDSFAFSFCDAKTEVDTAPPADGSGSGPETFNAADTDSSVASVGALPFAPDPHIAEPGFVGLANTEAGKSGAFAVGATIPATIGQVPEGAIAHQPYHAEAPAAVPPAELASLANPVPSTFAAPVTESTVGYNGATAAQVQAALDESGLSVNGTGITVGVLSDSFNNLGGAAADEADGALPPAADIDVIKDLSSGGSDEGRAMMQIIHDIAPGADLAFYTAFDGEQDFANGILALAAAGAKVIVDDVSYFDEPFFQNGVVAQAIQTVEAEGVTYVTAAGNDAGNAYQAAWSPISGTFDGTRLTDAESFASSLVQTLTVNTEGTGYDIPLLLQWNQAYGQATSDLEILVFNSSGHLVGTATNAAEGEATNPWVEYDFNRSGTYYIAIENLSGPNPGLIKEITEGNGLPATISGANVGTVYGHAMTPGAITAGAVSAADTPAFGINPAQSESFSSSGAGTELLFANNGTPLSSPDYISPVAVSGVDDVHTTVPGGLSDFYGTSAASASLAGVAALILSANPTLTAAQVEQIMEQTALRMTDSAVSGAGLAQVDPAVATAQNLLSPVVITETNQTVANNQSIPITDIYSVSGSGISEYQIWFSAADQGAPALGEVTDNGTAIPLNVPVTVSSLSALDYVGSATAGTDEMWLRAYDGVWSNWVQANITDPGAPALSAAVTTANNVTVADGQSVALSQIYSVSGSGITEYQIWFSAANQGAPALGDVTDDGTAIPLNAPVTVSSLSALDYIGSATAGTDEMWLRAYNGVWSTWVQADITDPGAPALSAAVTTANDLTVADGQSVALSQIYSVSGSGITEYQIWFSAANQGAPALGEVTDNGTEIPLNVPVTVSSLSGLDYIGSATAGTDEMWLRAYNGAWSTWVQANITDPGAPVPSAPVVTETDQTVAAHQSIPITDIYSIGGSGIAEYQVWFSAANQGAPALGEVTDNGTAVPLNVPVTVSSLSALDYIGSATAGTDEMWLRAYNGVWSNWVQANITDSGAPAQSAAVVTETDQTVPSHQSIPITDIYSVGGSGVAEYQIWFSAANQGAPALGEVTDSGTAIPLNVPVTVGSLSALDYIGSATAGTDEMWLRVYDGVWSTWVQANIIDPGTQQVASPQTATIGSTAPIADGEFGFDESGNAFTVSVAPQNGGAGYVGSFTADISNAASGQETVEWQFNLDPSSVAQTLTQTYNVTLANGASTATQSVSVTVGGPGNDTFVFKPGVGADVVANATSADTIELDGFAAVISINQVQTALAEAQAGQAQALFQAANGGHDTIINLGTHDSITLVNVQLAELHASNFVVHPPIIG